MKMKKYVKQVKKRIAKDEYDLFTTDQIIEDCSFIDFLFIGKHKDKEVVWNTCITTARGDYYEKISGECLAEAYQVYPEPEDYDFSKNFVPLDDGSGNSEWIDQNPELSDERYNYYSKLTIDELNKKELELDPWNIEIDEEYNYGVGLHVRMSVESINLSDVEEFINQFQNYGLNAFDDDKYDKTKLCLNAEELGVAYDEGDRFVKWVKYNPESAVALNITEKDLDD